MPSEWEVDSRNLDIYKTWQAGRIGLTLAMDHLTHGSAGKGQKHPQIHKSYIAWPIPTHSVCGQESSFLQVNDFVLGFEGEDIVDSVLKVKGCRWGNEASYQGQGQGSK